MKGKLKNFFTSPYDTHELKNAERNKIKNQLFIFLIIELFMSIFITFTMVDAVDVGFNVTFMVNGQTFKELTMPITRHPDPPPTSQEIYGDDYHEFDTWYKNANLTQEFTLGKPLSGNTTVYGRFTRKISATEFSLSEDPIIYDGQTKQPEIPSATWKHDGTPETLTQGTDYNITGYSNNINAGTATIAIEGIGDYSGTTTIEFTIQKADPDIGTVTASPNTFNPTIDFNNLTLSRSDELIPGTLSLDENQATTYPTTALAWTFTPSDTANYNTLKGTVDVTVTEDDPPTGTVSIENNTWTDFLNNVLFDLFFKETKTVTVTAQDNLSGIKSIEYIESNVALNRSALESRSDWKSMSFTSQGGVAIGSITVQAEDAKKFIYYIKLTDNSSNVTYLNTQGATYDLTPPVISGITNGATYYTTQQVTVTDANLQSVKLNNVETSSSTFTLTGNQNSTYTITAIDKAGNSTNMTVHMKPISSISQPIAILSTDNVTFDNQGTISQVKTAAQAVDTTHATDAEKAAISSIITNCDSLINKITEVTNKISDYKTAAEGYDINTVNSSNKNDIETLKTNIVSLLATQNLTVSQSKELTALQSTVTALITTIDEIVAQIQNITINIDPYSIDNVTSSDRDAIAMLQNSINDLLSSNNLTSEETDNLNTLSETVTALLATIDEIVAQIQNITDAVSSYSIDSVTSSDRDAIAVLQNSIDVLLGGNNLLQEQRDNLTALNEFCDTLLSKINDVAQKIDNYKAETDKHDISTIKTSDKSAIEELISNIENLLLDANKLTNEEYFNLIEIKTTAGNLIKKIEEISSQMNSLNTQIGNFNAESVKSTDKKTLQEIVDTIKPLLNGNNLTDDEKSKIEKINETASGLITVIDSAIGLTETPNIAIVKNINTDNVSLKDKQILMAAITDLQTALKDYIDHYTEDENQAILSNIDRINSAIRTIENSEAVMLTIGALPETVSPDNEEAAKEILAAEDAYNKLTDHEKFLVDKDTTAKLQNLLTDLRNYKVISESNTSWVKGSDEAFSFTVNASVSKFIGIKINGNEVDPINYDVKSGSTIIVFKKAYLDTLASGKYTITAVFKDGEVSVNLDIPPTYDDNHGSNPSPDNKLEGNPSPSDNLENNPSPSDNLKNNPSPSDNLESNPSPNDNLENNPDPNDNLENNPDPNDNLENNPSPNDNLENNPDPNNSNKLNSSLWIIIILVTSLSICIIVFKRKK